MRKSGATHRCNIGRNTSDTTSGTTHRMQHRAQHIGYNIGYNTSGATSDATHRAQYTYIYTYCFTNAYQPPIYARVLSRGVAPISTFCPYRARYFLNPVHGGTQGVADLRPALPWAEIPLPLQGAASSKPSKHCIKLAVKGGDTVAKHGSFEYAGPIHYSKVLKPRRPIQEPQRPVIIRRF